MKKTFTILGAILVSTVIITSCGNPITNDAKELANLQCKSNKAGPSDVAASTELLQLANKLMHKYKGEDLKKFEDTYRVEYAKCNN